MQFFDLAQQSLVKSGSRAVVVEEYIPLWITDGASLNSTNQSNWGDAFLDDNAGISYSSTSSSVKLHTLNSNWNPNQVFAIEATIYANSGHITYIRLYDQTLGNSLSNTEISTTSTTATVVRSGQFTLIPGHTYSVGIKTDSTNGTVFVSDASLIVFG